MTNTDFPGAGPSAPGSSGPEDTSASGPPGSAGRHTTDAPFAPAPARLTRSRTDRKIAGVCGGLGRYLDIDPLILRVVLVALTVVGGTGVVLYGLAWLLVPEEGTPQSEGERLLAGRRGFPLVAAIAGVMLAVWILALLSFHAGPPGLLVLLAVLGVGYAIAVKQGRLPGVASVPGPPPAGAPAADPWTKPATEPPAGVTAAPLPGEGEGSPPPPWTAGPYVPPEPAPSRPPREPAVLVRATLSLVALAVGGLVAWSLLTDGVLTVRNVSATILIVLGAGLVAGAWWGRARILLVPAVVAAGVLLSAVTTDQHRFDGGFGDRSWAPAGVADLQSPYRLAAGSGTLDLTGIDPAGGEVRVEAGIGMGELEVVLPADVDLVVDARTGLGHVELPAGDAVDGHGEVNDRREPAVGPSRGTVRLDLSIGLGQVEVRREAP